MNYSQKGPCKEGAATLAYSAEHFSLVEYLIKFTHCSCRLTIHCASTTDFHSVIFCLYSSTSQITICVRGLLTLYRCVCRYITQQDDNNKCRTVLLIQVKIYDVHESKSKWKSINQGVPVVYCSRSRRRLLVQKELSPVTTVSFIMLLGFQAVYIPLCC